MKQDELFPELFDNDDQINNESYDDLRITLDELHQAVVWGTDWTAETIVNQIEKGQIDLRPKFQRREAWDDKRKSAFIESVIAGLPIPQIILAEKKDKKGAYIVIDGKQRLISLRRFFSDANDDEFRPLRLKGLALLPDLNNKTYEDICGDAVLNNYISQVENQPIRTIVIKNWPNEEFLYNVFLRLNTGSLPLSTQELRQALHPGPFLDFCDEFSMNSRPIQTILNISAPDYRMRDIELVVRYFAFKYFIVEYPGNLKFFFDDAVNRLNDTWQQQEVNILRSAELLNSAISLCIEIFGDRPFRKWKGGTSDSRFNRAIYDIMVYYFTDLPIFDLAKQKKDEIRDAFIELCNNDAQFLSSFEFSTKNIAPTQYRFRTWGEKLSLVLQIPISIPEIRNE